MVRKLLFLYSVIIAFLLFPAKGFGQECPTSVGITYSPNTDICEGEEITFTANPADGIGHTYEWSVNGSIITSETSKIFKTPLSSTSTVKVVVDSNSGDCSGGVSREVSVTVNPKRTPTVSIVPSKTEICLGEEVTFTASNTDGGSGASYRWYISGVEKQNSTSRTFTTTELTESNKDVKVVLTSSLKCITPGEISAISSVSIKPDATITAQANRDRQICVGSSIEPIQFSIAGGGTGATVSGLPPGLSGSFSAGEFIISGSPTVDGEFDYTVTTTGTCTQTSSSGSILVYPSPTVEVPADIEVCNGASTSLISFSGQVADTDFNWTNSNSSIGLGGSGSGNIPAFTATNHTSTIVTATITVTPTSNGCTGTPKTVNIKVYPTPTVNSLSRVEICNGGTIPDINFSGKVSGSTYTWTNDNTNIGLAASGSGNITSFEAKNSSGSFPIVAKITVTPMANGCEGAPEIFEIVVNPTPNVDAISDVSVCNGETISEIAFSGNVPGTSYTWTNDNPAIGLESTGTGNISAFETTNHTNSPITANITVTPTAEECPGASKVFKITVKPTPNVNEITDIIVCNEGSVPAIAFSGGVSGTTYTWTNSNTAIGLAGSGSGNIPAFTAKNSTNSSITATIEVTPEADGCPGPSMSFDIRVDPTPSLNEIADIEICNGGSIPEISFSGGVTGTIYNWTNTNTNINLGSSGTGNIPAFTATNTSNTPISAVITVTPVADGCEGTPTDFEIIVNQSLVPSVTITSNDDDNNVCDIGDSVTFTASAVNGGSSPLYQWFIDGNPTGSNGSENTFTTSDLTDGQSVSVEMTTNETCYTTEKVISNTIVHQVYSALGDVTIDGPSGICPTNSTFTYSVPDDTNVMNYHWNVPSGFVIESGQGTHSVDISFTTPATGVNTISLERSNPCGTETDTFVVTIDSYAAVNAGPDQYVCVGTESVTLEGSIGGAVTGSGQNKWEWVVSGGSIHQGDKGNLNAPFNLPKDAVGGDEFTVTISTTSEVAGCTTQEDTMKVIVVADPTVSAGSEETDIACQSSSPTPLTLTGATLGGGATKGSWAIVSGGGTLSSTEPRETPEEITYTPAVDFHGEVILKLTTENPGNCSEVSENRTITVKPNPSVEQPNDLILCAGDTGNEILFSGSTISGTEYVWVNSDTSIGLGASGTGDISFDATNSTNESISATITVTPIAAGCEGSPKTFTITVNPTASVTLPEEVNNLVFCNGDTVDPINLTGSSVSNTTYKWVNNTPSIGLPAEGTGTIPQFIASNSGTAVVTAEIIVTPVANNCEGTPETFSITVNPTPSISALKDVVVCDGGLVSEIIFSGSEVENSIYTWKNDTPGINLAESGTGTITEFNAINSSTEVITATITVTPVANDCEGVPETFTITVNPNPGITLPSNVTVCNNEAVSPITLTGSQVAGTSYLWENDTPSIGLPENGTGNLPEFTAVNTTNNSVTATVTVTPVASECEGSPETFTITVKPTPTITPPSDVIVCTDGSVAEIVFSGSSVANTSYHWENDTPSIGLVASGTGNISQFDAINTTTEPVIAQITVTPIADSCEGTPETFSITVNPTPVVTVPEDIVVCDGEIISPISFTSEVSGAVLSWSNNNADIGLAASGTEGLPEFTATNKTANAIEATITVTPTANNCEGNPQVFTITVNPTAIVDAGADQSICSSETATMNAVLSGGATSGTWTTSGSGSFSDNSINAIYTPSASDIVNGTVTLTLTSNDPEGPCTAASDSIVLTISEEVNITSQPFSVGVCTANDTQLEVAASGDDLTYTWYKIGITDPVGTGPTYQITNATVSDEGEYYVKVTGSSICSEEQSNTVTVTVDENIEVLQHPVSDNICTGTNHTLSVDAIASDSSEEIEYTWMFRPAGSTNETDWQNIYTGANYVIEAASSDDTGEYRVKIKGPEGYNCSTGYSEIATISVYGIPTADAGVETAEICSTTSPIQIGTGAGVSEGASGLWTTNGTGDLINASDVTGATYIPKPEDFGQDIEFTLTATLNVEGLESCADSGSSDTKVISIIHQPEITAFSYISDQPEATTAEFCETDSTLQTPQVTTNHQNGKGTYSVGQTNADNPLFVDPNSGEFTANGTTPGTYIITYSFTANSNNTCTTASKDFTVIIGEQPSAGYSYSASSFCNSERNPIPQPAGEGVLGNFKSSPGGLIFVENGAPGEINLINSSPGTYTITNTVDFENDGCQPVSFESTVTIYAQPAAPEISDLEYCLGEENVPGFSVTPSEDGSINWYESSEATTAMESAPTISTATVKTTSYWVSETSADGCESERIEAKITINGLPEVSITTEGNPDGEEVTICKGSSIVLTGNGATSYTWRAGSMDSDILGEESTFSANPTETTTYFLTGENETGCKDISEITIVVDTPTVLGTLTGPTSVCVASPSGILTLADFTGEIQRWESSEDGTTWTEIANITETLEFSGITTATSYRAIVKNGVCEEAPSNQINVTIDELPEGGALAFEGIGRLFLTCENAEDYAVPLFLNDYYGEIEEWQYHNTSNLTWQAFQTADPGVLSPNEIESIVANESTVFRVKLKNGACSAPVYSQTAILSVIPSNIEPSPVEVDPIVLCYGSEVTLSSKTGYGESFGKFEGGAFDNAGIKNHGWNFTNLEGGSNDFDSGANNGRADHWLRMNPHGKNPNANEKVYTANIESPSSGTMVNWDSSSGTEGNKGFGIVTGDNDSNMETPIFSLNGMDEAILTFDQAYNLTNGATIIVEISTDGGQTYPSDDPNFSFEDEHILHYVVGDGTVETGSSGNYDNFGDKTPAERPKNKMVINLGDYLGQPNLRIRFKYIGVIDGDVWAVDNIKVPEGPQGVLLQWFYDEDPNDDAIYQIGADNQEVVSYPPPDIDWTKMGWNDFEVKTALLLDSQGNACESLNNSERVRVFVFDKYETTVSVDIGSCGDFSATLDASITSEFQGDDLDEAETTIDGYKGEWKIVGTDDYILRNQDDASSLAPEHNPHVILESEFLGDITITWELKPTATYPEDYFDETLRGETIENPACPPQPQPQTISLEHCTTLDFDGIDDYVDLGSDYPAPTSIEAWIRPFGRENPYGGYTDASNGTIISGPGFEIKMEDLSGKIETDSRWYHIAVVDGKLFIDGIERGSSGNGIGGDKTLIGARWNNDTSAPENYFSGWIEEVRIWDTALTQKQIRFMMNQRIKEVAAPTESTAVEGEVVPIQGVGSYKTDSNGFNLDEDNEKWYGLTYGDLSGYYRLISDEPDPLGEVTYEHLQPFNGTTPNLAIGGKDGILRNMETHQQNTSPLPYISGGDGKWIDRNTWLRPDVWDIPNSNGNNGEEITWNIAKTKHNISSEEKDIELLGLLVEAGELDIAHPAAAEPFWKNLGQELRVTHYLKLNGTIDLTGESQLLQNVGSIIDPGSTGQLERDQQGRASSYNYNYWTPPVRNNFESNTYTVGGVMNDGTAEPPVEIDFAYPYTHADGAASTPRKVSSYWLYEFHGTAYTYAQWHYVGTDGRINIGEGFSMKGTTGPAELDDLQNYTFIGMPNNGPITLTIGPNQDYLIGNPYPSAIDADKFISDNEGNFTGSVYFWSHFSGKTHYLEEYIGGYATYSRAGGVIAIATDERINATGDDNSNLYVNEEPGRYIPVGQAFFISSGLKDSIGSTQGGAIILDNSQRVYVKEGPESLFHQQENGRKAEKAVTDRRAKIWLKFKSPTGYHRQLLVTADSHTTNGFDIGYDAPLIENNKEDMYWVFDNSKFVIQGVSHFNLDQELPLGLKVEKEAAFTISIDKLQEFPEDKPIYLKDSLLSVTHNLREGPYETTASKGVIDNRFKIVFKLETPPGDEETEKDPDEGDEVAEEGDGVEILTDIEILYLNGSREILVRNPQLIGINNIVINNVLGQRVQRFTDIPLQKELKLPVNQFSSGVYIVKLLSSEGTMTEKIILE